MLYTIEQINTYVDETVVNSYVWDNADNRIKTKAVNRADMILTVLLGDILEVFPVEVIAEQAVWLLKIDDTIERAEQGISNVMIDGTMISIKNRDTSIAPMVYKLLGIPTTATGSRRKIGAYKGYYSNSQRWGSPVLRRVKDE
jgi:hypothetical protein